MYFSLFASIIMLSTTAVSVQGNWDSFMTFVHKYKRVYHSLEIMEERYQVYKQNMLFVEEQNSREDISYVLGETPFADMSHDEFKQYKSVIGSEKTCDAFHSTVNNNASVSSVVNQTIPSSVDWREKGAVTPVKDQGQCGSCWSFSATGAMEGAWQIASGKLVSLSEQQLVDCSAGFKYGNHGCNGGLMDGAFHYAMEHGMCAESDYGYTAKDGNCESCETVVKIYGCTDVTPKNEVDLEEAVSRTPVSVAIEADTRVFQLYTGGVLTSDACGTTLDHGVLVVGYGSENDIDYWIVKNSWSSSWGENGYIRIAKSSSTNTPGICGIAMQPSFPMV